MQFIHLWRPMSARQTCYYCQFHSVTFIISWALLDKTQRYRDSVCKPAVSVLRQRDFLPDTIRIINVSRDISADCSAVFMCLYINTDRACLLHFDKSFGVDSSTSAHVSGSLCRWEVASSGFKGECQSWHTWKCRRFNWIRTNQYLVSNIWLTCSCWNLFLFFF